MSFEVKNIEQENINHKMIAPLTGFVIITIIASLVFVYYYFTFEKDAIMKEQYLEAESEILKNHKLNENKKYEALNVDGEDGKIGKMIEDFYNKTIEERLNELGSLENQLQSDAFVELIERGEKDPEKGVQAFYKDRVIEIQWIIEDPGNTYSEYNMTPDGKWGPDSYDEWEKWLKRSKK